MTDQADALALPPRVRDALPSTVKTEINKLTRPQQEAFIEEFNRKAKSTGLSYVLWLFGLHYAYFGDWPKLVIFWFTGFGLMIWWLVDAFRMPGLVAEYNRDVAAAVMRDIKLMSM